MVGLLSQFENVSRVTIKWEGLCCQMENRRMWPGKMHVELSKGSPRVWVIRKVP